MRRAALVAVLLVTGFSVTLATSKSYDVAPYSNCVSQIVTSNGAISQYYRNTLDSLVRISWWCGDTFSGGLYKVEVKDSVTGSLVAHGPLNGQPATQCWTWLNFPLVTVSSPVRGRTYKVTITNQITPAGGPISFAYDPRDPYKYGHAVANNSSPSLPDGSDLALRVCGTYDALDGEFWGATCLIPAWESPYTQRNTWDSLMQEAGLGWGVAYCHWEIIEPESGAYDFRDLDAPLRQMCMDQPFGKYKPVVPIQNCPKWASTRIESIWHGNTLSLDTCIRCAPRGLDTEGNGNHWTRFIDTLLGHWDQCVENPVWRPCDSVHIWEINNENNDLETLNTFDGIAGWWQRPNLCYSVAPTPWSLCSLYIVQARQAEQTIHSDSNHSDDTILISSVRACPSVS